MAFSKDQVLDVPPPPPAAVQQRGEGVMADGQSFFGMNKTVTFFSVRKYRGCDWGRDFVETFA